MQRAQGETASRTVELGSSVLATCHENGINAFDYLCAVQRHRETVRREPDRWLPWNYTSAAVEATAAAKTAEA